MSKEYYKRHLNLEKHIEGGFFYQTYQSDILKTGKRNITSIYFLIEKDDFSAFHQLQSDEIWYFHDGNSLVVHEILPTGEYKKTIVGKNLKQGEVLSYVVKAGNIFASETLKDYSLVSCAVAPGFDYQEFKLFTFEELSKQFPQHQEIIKKLTRQ